LKRNAAYRFAQYRPSIEIIFQAAGTLVTFPHNIAGLSASWGGIVRNDLIHKTVYLILAGSPGWLSAQTQPQTPGAPALEEVTVTAQRREESLQRAALAVTAVSAEQLESQGVTRVQDLRAFVPAVQLPTAAGPFSLFYLRGVGNFNGNSLSDAAVALNLDGVYIARPSSTAGLFYDLERVEVLKGPQGTLYGRNATAGAINLITRKPAGEFGGDAQLDFGNYGLRKFDGAVNAPLSSTVAARLAVQSIDHDGYLSDGTDDDKSRAARLQVSFRPNDALSLLTSADYYHQGGQGVGSSLLTPAGFVNGDPRIGMNDPRATAVFTHTLVFPAAEFLGAPLQKLLLAPAPATVHQDNNYWGLSATANWTTSAGTLTVIPAYRHSKLDFVNDEPSFLLNQQETDKQTSLEARFASPEERRWSYLVGAYYLDESSTAHTIFDQQVNAAGEQLNPNTKSYASFGRLRFSVTDALRLTGGIRYTRDDKFLTGSFVGSQVLCPAFLGWFNTPPAFRPPAPPLCIGGNGAITVPSGPPIDFTGSNSKSHSWSETTWRAGVEWDARPQSLLYASVETGFKAGGYFFTDDNPIYNPEKLTAYTVGSKNRFLANRLQVNAEAFYWQYHDQQISHTIRDSVGTVIFATENVGRATMKGLEAETQLLVTDTTLISADLEYLDAVYQDFNYNLPNFGSPPTTACPFVPNGATLWNVNCSGFAPPQSPRWAGNIGIQQTIHLGHDDSLIVEGRTRYQSDTLTGLEFLPQEVQHRYWMSSALLTYRGAGERWSVTAYINNIENRNVMNLTSVHPIAGNAITGAAMDPPRTYGARLAVKF